MLKIENDLDKTTEFRHNEDLKAKLDDVKCDMEIGAAWAFYAMYVSTRVRARAVARFLFVNVEWLKADFFSQNNL